MEVREAFVNREFAAKCLSRNLINYYDRVRSEFGGSLNITAEDYELLLEGLEKSWITEPFIKTEAGIMIGQDAVNILSKSL